MLVKAGEVILCRNRHVCGKLLVDVQHDANIVFSKHRSDGVVPFSLEFELIDWTDTGHT